MQKRSVVAIASLALAAAACGPSDPGADISNSGQGGVGNGGARSSTGGAVAPAGGSTMSTGGATAGGNNATTGGSSPVAGGNQAAGGAQPNVGGNGSTTGGTANRGGATATGGNGFATGGAVSKGGTSSGGTAAGGADSGDTTATGGTSNTAGSAAGSKAAGGTVTGGASTGGKAAGGAATGGVATGGTSATNTGGSGACTWSDPPSSVSAWVNESWNAQLGANVKNLKRWLLDSAMLGKGQINLCMRWGASTAPSATVKSGIASTYQKWFNGWFSQLEGYGCFPYPSITVKVTGWAVKSGNTSWVSDVDTTTAKIYTATDGSGEPKCPDSCSFFSNPSHSFPSCPGGETFHHDYWVWIDDGNAAAGEGGDWGIRVPVAALNNAMSNVAYDVNTFMHEMGHGFGFQDYYDWTGSTPAGGSLMIVGPNTTSPTVGDTWLIRRTWKEMKTLRGW